MPIDNPAIIAQAPAQLIANGFNKSKTYRQLHPNASEDTVYAYSSTYMEKHGIEEKAIALLNSRKKSHVKQVLDDFCEDLGAEKPIVVDKQMIMVRDNTTQLQARIKAMEIHGIIGRDNHSKGDTYNTQLNINTATEAKLGKLIDRIEQLESKANKEEVRREQADHD